MRTNLKTIKVTAWFSLLLVVVTYLISIKGVFGESELKWLPDTFLLAVFGGTFASMLVVLICEIAKYIQNRESTETFLFSHLYFLYGQLYVIKKNIEFMSAKEDRVHKDALSQLIANSEAEMNAIFFTDYFPYRKNNAILSEKISKRKITCTYQRAARYEIMEWEVAERFGKWRNVPEYSETALEG